MSAPYIHKICQKQWVVSLLFHDCEHKKGLVYIVRKFGVGALKNIEKKSAPLSDLAPMLKRP